MGRLLATFVTLGLLSGFLLAVVLGLMVAFGAVNIVVAVAVVVLFNLLLLLIGPKLNDALYRWLYDLEWVDFEEFRRRSPESAAVVEEVTTDYGYDRPKLGLIPDRNPTAFTYGSRRFNGRIVVTEGCFEYLDDNELSSVLAHELGHITSRDFIIMTLANTIVEVLYLVAVHSARIASAGGAGGTGGGSSGSKDKATSALFAVAYVLWFVGEYAVLYLSRTREYAADRFAAEYTHPDYLSSALVKIAYGIILSDDSPELEQATRNIGIMNAEQSKDEGVVYYNCERMDDFEPLMKSFLFDLENPWAKVSEITSTHPLTGKRVRALSGMEGAQRFDFEGVRERYSVDRRRLYTQFLRDIAYLSLPVGLAVLFPLVYLAGVLVNALPLSLFFFLGSWALTIAVGVAAKAYYRYSVSDEYEETTVLELLSDIYASPVDGRLVELNGELIGRGQAGYRFSEDVMFQDRTGLMYIRYESWIPLIGNLLFAVRKVPELVGSEVQIRGWYLRGTSPWVGMWQLVSDEETIEGYIHIGGYVLAGFLAGLGAVLVGIWLWL